MTRRAVDLLANELRSGRSGKPVRPSYITLDYTVVRRQSDAVPGLARCATRGSAGRPADSLP